MKSGKKKWIVRAAVLLLMLALAVSVVFAQEIASGAGRVFATTSYWWG